MIEQPVALKRCASCERWGGTRTAGNRGESVLVASEQDGGPCRGGPWDGETRRVRSACGRWTIWLALVQAGGAAGG